MNKELKDYLPFYLGCQFVMKIKDTEQLTGKMYFGKDALYAALTKDESVNIKPILLLRKLDSITDDEKKEIFPDAHIQYDPDLSDEFTPDEFVSLLSKHFDLFGLIESGIAIDKSLK
jgi:hypothetical protein